MDPYYEVPVHAEGLSKVPEVTLGFWVIKILATTLGETGGDAVTMSMKLGWFKNFLCFSWMSPKRCFIGNRPGLFGVPPDEHPCQFVLFLFY